MPGGVQTSRLPLPATIIKQKYLPSLRASDPTLNSTEGTQFSRIRCRQESRWGSRAEPRGFPSHVYTLGKQSARKQSACQSSYRRWKSLTLAFWVGATTPHRGSMPKWCDTEAGDLQRRQISSLGIYEWRIFRGKVQTIFCWELHGLLLILFSFLLRLFVQLL